MIMKIMIITTFMMIMTIEIKVFFPPPTDGLSCKNCPSCHCLPLPGRHHQDDQEHHHNDQDDRDNDDHDHGDHERYLSDWDLQWSDQGDTKCQWR